MESGNGRIQDSELLEQFSRLLSRLTSNESLEELTDAISAMVDCPVAILDNKLRLIAASRRGAGTARWEQLLTNNGHRFVRALYNIHRDTAYHIEPLEKEGGQTSFEVFFPIRADNVTNELDGVVYLICPDEAVPRRYGELLHFVCRTLSWYLWRYTHMPNQQDVRLNLLLTDILNGHKVAEKERESVLTRSLFQTNRELRLLVIETSAMERNDYTLEHLKHVFGGIWQDSYSFPFSADILILLPERSGEANWDALTEQLKNFNCFAGVSGAFRSVDERLMHHYIRALTAARMARKLKYTEGYAHYNEIALYNMVSEGPPPVSLRQLCDPLLMDLVDHDKYYGTQYLYTLCCYWQLNRDISRVCGYMHLHRNTLYYRLAKIRELLQQDIDDYENFLQLNLSLNIMKVYGEIPDYKIRMPREEG